MHNFNVEQIKNLDQEWKEIMASHLQFFISASVFLCHKSEGSSSTTTLHLVQAMGYQ